MNKDFFASLDERIKSFADRTGAGERLEATVVLHGGRSYLVDRVADLGDDFVQLDGRNAMDDDEKTISIVVPYHQVSHVTFGEARPRAGGAGFRVVR